jgi:hypothetical protein
MYEQNLRFGTSVRTSRLFHLLAIGGTLTTSVVLPKTGDADTTLVSVGAISESVAENAHNGRTFNGVEAMFEVVTPTIRVSQSLCIKFTFRNVSSQPKSFRYAASIMPNTLILDSRGQRLTFRRDAPTPEPVAPRIPLQPGGAFVTKICAKIADYYELSPGTYYLQFRYDLRLIDDPAVARRYMKLYQSRDFVLWDRRRYSFVVAN